jgi:membrane fusion protein
MTNRPQQRIQPLFRQEVLDSKRGDWLGSIRLATPLSHRVLTGLTLTVGAALLMFLMLGQYTRRERTSGMLVPIAGLIDVKAAVAGTVTRTLVDQGSNVHAEDLLIALSSERVSLSVGDTGAAVSEQLKLQHARIEADLADLDKLAQEQKAGITNRLELLRAQLVPLDGQLVIQREQVRSARSMLERIQPLLEKGYISALQLQQQESAALEAEAQTNVLARQRLDTEQQISTQQDQLSQLPLTTQTQRHDLERKRGEIEQALDENEAQRASVLRAPEDGVVASMFVKPGQPVSAGQTLLAIVPKGSELQAELLVSSRAIGFVRPDTLVVLRYQAYPFQKFGLQSGRVKAVAHSAMTPAQVASLLGQQTQEALYRVDVELDRQTVEAYGKEEALKPGMALDADLLLDRRRLIEWVFEPLYGMGQQAGEAHG